MSSITEQVRSLWIPLREVNMLLPNAAVAEIGRYRLPESQPDRPDWMLGTISWRDRTIPLISIEALCGHQVPANMVYSRLMIINSVRPDSHVRFYAIVTAGMPRSIQFDNSVADDIEESELQVIPYRVYVGREQAVIPDLGYIQGLVEQHWDAAA